MKENNVPFQFISFYLNYHFFQLLCVISRTVCGLELFFPFFFWFERKGVFNDVTGVEWNVKKVENGFWFINEPKLHVI